jgi:hypothetical protein
VGRTTTTVEAVSKDLAVLDEAVVGEDPTAVGEVTVTEDLATVGDAVSGRGGMEVDAEEERAHGLDPAAVGEAVSKALAVAVNPMAVQAWRHAVEE